MAAPTSRPSPTPTDPAAGRDATKEEHARPGGPAFWVGLVVGGAVMGYAVWGILEDRADTNPAALARWVIGADLLHDLLLAPIVTVVALALGRVLPDRARAPVTAAMALSGLVVLFSWPLLRGYGRHPLNGSALPRSYGPDVALVVGLVWLIALVAVAGRLVRDRGSEP
jgi:hypothetical protein